MGTEEQMGEFGRKPDETTGTPVVFPKFAAGSEDLDSLSSHPGEQSSRRQDDNRLIVSKSAIRATRPFPDSCSAMELTAVFKPEYPARPLFKGSGHVWQGRSKAFPIQLSLSPKTNPRRSPG